MKCNDIPLTTVTCLFTPPKYIAKLYSSCRFPRELFQHDFTSPFLFLIPLFILLFFSSISGYFRISILVSKNFFHSRINNFCTVILFCCICILSITYFLHFTPFSPHNAHFYSIIKLCLLKICILYMLIHILISLPKMSSFVKKNSSVLHYFLLCVLNLVLSESLIVLNRSISRSSQLLNPPLKINLSLPILQL